MRLQFGSAAVRFALSAALGSTHDLRFLFADVGARLKAHREFLRGW